MLNDDKKIFRVVNGENTYLMLPSSNHRKSVVDFDIVYTIPSSKIRCLMEFQEDSNERFIKVIALYWDNHGKQILETFNLDLERKMVSDVEKRIVNGSIEVINPTTFYYKDDKNIKTMLSIYGNQIQPQMSKISNSLTEGVLAITDVTLGNYYIDNNRSEIVLHIGNYERLHLLLIPPTKKYQFF